MWQFKLCEECLFWDYGSNCDIRALEWADAEYIEPEIDWSKMPVDTPIMVSQNEINWYPRYFAGYEDEEVYAWNDGLTSFMIESDNLKTRWFYAKLANED